MSNTARAAASDVRRRQRLVARWRRAVQAVIEFKLDGTIMTANENFLGAMGYSLAEVAGQHHRIFMPSADRDSPAYRELAAHRFRGAVYRGLIVEGV